MARRKRTLEDFINYTGKGPFFKSNAKNLLKTGGILIATYVSGPVVREVVSTVIDDSPAAVHVSEFSSDITRMLVGWNLTNNYLGRLESWERPWNFISKYITLNYGFDGLLESTSNLIEDVPIPRVVPFGGDIAEGKRWVSEGINTVRSWMANSFYKVNPAYVVIAGLSAFFGVNVFSKCKEYAQKGRKYTGLIGVGIATALTYYISREVGAGAGLNAGDASILGMIGSAPVAYFSANMMRDGLLKTLTKVGAAAVGTYAILSTGIPGYFADLISDSYRLSSVTENRLKLGLSALIPSAFSARYLYKKGSAVFGRARV